MANLKNRIFEALQNDKNVETILDDFSKDTNPNEEPCDLGEQIDKLINELETAEEFTNTYLEDMKSDVQDLENDLDRVNNLIEETNNSLEILVQDYGKHLPDCENNIDSEYEHLQN